MVDYNSLNDTHKRAAARRAAAKYSYHLDRAVITFMENTGLLKIAPDDFQHEVKHHFDDLESLLAEVRKEDPSFMLDDDPYYYDPYHYQWQVTHAEPFLKAQEEMLSLLPGYRHPLENFLIEQEIFFGDIGIQFGKALGHPDWLRDYEGLSNDPKALMSEIRKYVDEAELVKRRYSDEKNTTARLQGLLDNAREDYRPTYKGENPDKRARRVAAGLGLSKGKRKKEYTDCALYTLYVYLVRREGKPRQDAIKSVAKSFDLAENTILQDLNSIIAVVKEIRRNEAPHYWPIHKKYLTGLVPFKGDWSL